MYVEIAFAFGLLAALLATIHPLRYYHLILVAAVFMIALILAAAEGATIVSGNSFAGSGIVTAAVATSALTAIICMKRLRVAIDEFEYVVLLGILWYMTLTVSGIGEKLFASIIALSLLALGVVCANRVPGKLVRFFLFISYSIMVAAVFFVYVGFATIETEVFSLSNDLTGALEATLIGWTFFHYFVHLVFLFLLLPNRRWGSSLKLAYDALPYKFRTMQYDLVILLAGFVGSVLLLLLLEVMTSILVAIGVVTSLASYVGHRLRAQNKVPYVAYQPADLIPDRV